MEDPNSQAREGCVVDTVNSTFSLEITYIDPLTSPPSVNSDDFMSRWRMTNQGPNEVLNFV